MAKFRVYANLMMIDNFDYNHPASDDANEMYVSAIRDYMDPKEETVVYSEGGKRLVLDYCEFDEDILPYLIASGVRTPQEAVDLADAWSKADLTPYVEGVIHKIQEKYPDLKIDYDFNTYISFEIDDLDESRQDFNRRGNTMKDSKITQEQLDEAIKVAEAHGYKVVGESAKQDDKEALIQEAIKVAEAHGYKVLKEDEGTPAEVPPEAGATAETPSETTPEDNGELFTIQVTKAELEAIKSIIDKVEYEDDGSADAEQAAAVVSAMDNENVYGSMDED